MSENRRPTTGQRGQTTKRPRARKPDTRGADSGNEESYVNEEENVEVNIEKTEKTEKTEKAASPESPASRESHSIRQENRGHHSDRKQAPRGEARDENDLDEKAYENTGTGRQQRNAPQEEGDFEEEPLDSQPSYLGRNDDIESQPSDEYMIETHFDLDRGLFTGSIMEFPELKAQGSNRELVMSDLEAQLGQKLEDLRHNGSQVPEPFSGKQYPDSIQVHLSQSLFSKLDRLSRIEKIDIDRLVAEMITRALDRRDTRNNDRRPPIQSQSSQHGGQGQGHRHSGQRHQNRRGGGGQHRGGRSYNNSSQSGENFMEYVRNLENRGGSWRKK